MTYRIVKQEATTMTVAIRCPFCGEERLIESVPVAGIILLEMGENVQQCFPDMPVDDREMFISGVCPDCFPKEE